MHHVRHHSTSRCFGKRDLRGSDIRTQTGRLSGAPARGTHVQPKQVMICTVQPKPPKLYVNFATNFGLPAWLKNNDLLRFRFSSTKILCAHGSPGSQEPISIIAQTMQHNLIHAEWELQWTDQARRRMGKRPRMMEGGDDSRDIIHLHRLTDFLVCTTFFNAQRLMTWSDSPWGHSLTRGDASGMNGIHRPGPRWAFRGR